MSELLVQDNSGVIARAGHRQPHKRLRGTKLVKSLKNHFFKYVVIPESNNDCMEWQGYVNPSGYGKLMHDLKPYRAHRLSYLVFKGEIPKEKEVCHMCDNKKCINPSHLFLGTHQQNMNDMVKKGRQNSVRGSQHANSKLNESKVKEIKKLLLAGVFQRTIAKQFGVHQSIIKEINLNRRWKHVK